MNKKLLKIASIVTYISGAILLISRLLSLFFRSIFSYAFTNLFSIPGIILAVVTLIAGYRLMEAYNDRATKEEVIIWGIALVIIAYAIAGIITLIAAFTNDDFNVNTNFKSESNLERKLKELEQLYEKGLITKDEYIERRKKIIEDI